MHFDTTTLMFTGGLATALSGFLLLGVWTQLRQATALLWWFAANVIYAAGIVLLATGLSNSVTPLIFSGVMIGDAAPPLIWFGVRAFNRRRTPPIMGLLAFIAWLAIDLTAFGKPWGPEVSFAGSAAWLAFSALELCCNHSERIPARLPLAAVLLIHAAVYLGGIYDALFGNLLVDGVPSLNSWFGAILFEGIFYAMASATLMAMLCKEHETREYRNAARNDSLTGIANHGALLESARRTFERCHTEGTPFSLIMFDLDHFKVVNDVHGHRAGDEILRSFTDTVRHLLRPTDLFGRYGGEEFAIVLPGATVETAHVIAERVRHAFAERHRFLDGQPLNATVSAGVAAAGPTMSFEDTIDAADRAMYRAKQFGRNRVERADQSHATDGQDTVVRIA